MTYINQNVELRKALKPFHQIRIMEEIGHGTIGYVMSLINLLPIFSYVYYEKWCTVSYNFVLQVPLVVFLKADIILLNASHWCQLMWQ